MIRIGRAYEAYGKLAWCVLFFLVIISSCLFLVNETRKLHVSFLDIGQGDAILIRTPSGHTMLVDGGPNDAVLSRMNEELPFLTNDIDVVVATHPDSDHVTGLIPVLEHYDVHAVIVSGETSDTGVFKDLDAHIQDEQAELHTAHAGDVIDFQDGVKATILHPYPNEHFKDTNSASVSLLLSYGDETFLLTGDLPSTNEPLLISSGFLPHDVSVYKAGHHGSKYSSGDQLLSYITPKYSVVSAGKDNRYGHPNPEALLRLAKYSHEILSTIDKGTIDFVSDGRMLEVATEK